MKKTERTMKIRMMPAATLMLPLLLISWLFVGCTEDQPTGIEFAPDSEVLSFGQSSEMTVIQDEDEYELLKQVRQATARFNSTNQATRAGYVGGPCVADPELGGMGQHWVNGPLVDPVFDPLQPEALLYEPDKNGNLKLVGVEYIVIDIRDIPVEEGGNPNQVPPQFSGQQFDIGGTPNPNPHWSLHVWLYKENPDGIFAPWNPNVSCPA